MIQPQTRIKNRNIIFIALLILTVFGLYWKTFNHEFVWDDKIYFKQSFLFTENKPLSEAFKIGYFREQLGLTHVDFYYRPLLTLSFMIENKLWGLNPISLRLINFLLYILSLSFLYFFLKHQSDKDYFPEIGTLLFALFPLNVENIVWIVGRGDLLMLFWGILTLLSLELFIKKKKFLFLLVSSLFYLFGIFSKESILFFLPFLVLYEFIKRKKLNISYHLTNIIITACYFILKNHILGIKNLKFIFFYNFFGDFKTAVLALGYYFRSLIFPIYYDMFLPISALNNLLYLVFGITAIFTIFFLLYKSIKDKGLLLPLSLTIIFMAGHVFLIFTPLFPFKIYSRYMMIPALGIIWIFSKYICKFKEKIRNSIVFIILITFIPSIILNANSFKNEMTFWQRADHSSPNNGYVLFQLAKDCYEKKDYLSAELYLNKTLSLNIRKETAMLVSLLYTDIEFQKADYNKVFKWLHSIEEFETNPNIQLAPFIQSQIDYKRGRIYAFQGNISQAENLFEKNIQKYKNIIDSYQELYKMYIGHNLWDKAKNLENKMKLKFPSSFKDIDTAKTREDFNAFTTDKKISFYIYYRNFPEARQLVQSLSPLDFDHKLFLAKIYYWEGKEEEGDKILDDFLAQNSNQYEKLNQIGFMFLKDLYRVRKAVDFFRKSLDVNKDQPEIIYLVSKLTNEYLNKLTDAWGKK